MAIFGVINTADGGDTFYEGMVKAKDNFATLETEITDARDGKASTHAAIAEKVTGPSTNTADYVPQWNGTNSKTLKDGFEITAAGKAIVSAESMDAMVSSLASSGLVMKKGTDITVTVGSGGDYSTINDALAALSAYYPLYVSGGFTAEISLLSGFVMAEQVIVSGIDLSWITITSVDAEVVIAKSALATAVGEIYPAFCVDRGALPAIGALFSMDTSGTASTFRSGIGAFRGGRVFVSSGCGVKNSPYAGVYGYMGADIMAYGSVFTGNNRGVILFRACRGSFDEANISECAAYGVQAGSGSILNVRNANCQMGASPASTDIYVTGGAFITAYGATGGLSQTANTLTANGIIYQ